MTPLELAVEIANAVWPVRDEPLTWRADAVLKVLEAHAAADNTPARALPAR